MKHLHFFTSRLSGSGLLSAAFLLFVAVGCARQPEMSFHAIDCPEEMTAFCQQKHAGEKAVPCLLYLTHKGNAVGERLEQEVFTDSALWAYTSQHLHCFRGDTVNGHWSSFIEDFGIASLPVLMLFSPEGELLIDISHLGFIGKDENGDLPCRKGMMRPMKLAVKMMEENDSLFFSRPNWHQVELASIRLDSKLFAKLIDNRLLLEALYGNDYHVVVDYAISQAAVNLVTTRDTVPECLPHRREAFFRAIDEMVEAGFPETGDYCCTRRYRFYGDINIALGLGDWAAGRQLTEKAFADSIISSQEYHQLLMNLQPTETESAQI